MKQIIINKEYFDNGKKTIESLNNFFTSEFKNKDFPVIEDDFQVDPTLMTVMSWLNNVEPSWIENPSEIDNAIDKIDNDTAEIDDDEVYQKLSESEDNETFDLVNAFVGFSVLQYIADNFALFSSFINAIYSFDLFIHPSKYRDEIELFSKPVPLNELSSIMSNTDFKIYDNHKYVNGIFESEYITLPDDFDENKETQRMEEYRDLQDVEVVIDENVQEAATINYFEESKPKNISYDVKSKKWSISKQFEKTVNDLVAALNKCDTTEDLNDLFSKNTLSPDDYTDTLIPFILMKIFNNEKKYSNKFNKDKANKFIDSYTSIVDKNNGAKRFQNYDLFSTFKNDKEGTIKFIEDFFKLKFVNDENCIITNNTLLTIFNIFDSHIYYELLFNLIPEKDTGDDNVFTFIKEKRAILNKNSHENNVYQSEPDTSNEVKTTTEVQEFVSSHLKECFKLSTSDMEYNDLLSQILYAETSTLCDSLYNNGISSIEVCNYITESCNDYFQEQETGDVPNYMKNRIKVSKDMGKTTTPRTTDVQLPPDVPENDIPELAESIDNRLDMNGDLEDKLGSGYDMDSNKNKHIVINITNNYNDSFNTDSHNTHNDLSSGKRVTTHNTNESSANKTSNNNNNSRDSADTKDSNTRKQIDDILSSTGVSLQEMFTFLESEEPLSSKSSAGKPPKADSLTKAMDRDRELLSVEQSGKKKLQKVQNTGKAMLKPITRIKEFLNRTVDSLIKSDEDKVKAEIVENSSYRGTLKKAARLALKIGAIGVCFTINSYLGAAVGIASAANAIGHAADKPRLRREVQSEAMAEIEIVNRKIEDARNKNDKEEEYRLIRLRSKLEQMAGDSVKQTFVHPHSVA